MRDNLGHGKCGRSQGSWDGMQVLSGPHGDYTLLPSPEEQFQCCALMKGCREIPLEDHIPGVRKPEDLAAGRTVARMREPEPAGMAD